MSDDWQRVSVQFSADISDLNRKMAKIESATNRAMKTLVTEARNASTQVNKIFDDLGRRASASIAAIGAAVGAKELMGLSDSWTTLNNKVAAVSQSTGMQARSMSDLVKGADDARSSIEAYTDLYTKLMRSASGVAKNEEEIARATNIVSKAFVAGGAAASEQAASILQLGQALSSGILQGDELHSLRENAPLLAEAIAKEFNTTVGALKDLGAEGKLTADRVFKAILSAGKDIEKQFDATNATMADGFTRVKNALTEYVGIGGQASGVSYSITQGLIMIADNFDKVAKAGLVVLGVMAGQLVGRALPALVSRLVEAGIAAKNLYGALKSASSLSGVLASIGGGGVWGLAGAAVGGAVMLAMNAYMQSAADAAERTKTLKEELRSMGLVSDDAGKKVEELTKKTDNLGRAENLRRINMINQELRDMRYGDVLGEKEDSIPALIKKVNNSRNGGDDDKAAQALISFLSSLKQVPALAVEAGDQMEQFRKQLDLTDPLTQVTYDIENFAQTMRGLLINAQIKGEDLISPETERYIRQLDLDIRVAVGEGRDDALNAVKSLWEEYKKGNKTIQEVEQELNNMGEIGEGTTARLIKIFNQYTDAITATKKALSEANGELTKFDVKQVMDYVKNSPVGHWAGVLMNSSKNYTAAMEFKAQKEKEFKRSKREVEIDDRAVAIKREYEQFAKIRPEDNPMGQEFWTYLAKQSLGQQDGWKKPKKEKQNEYERLTQSMNDRIEVIKSETAATAQLNPLVNDYGYSLEKAKKQQELLNAAKKSEIALTPEVLASIEQQASGYAKATSEQAKLAEQQEKIRRRYEAIKDSSQDATHTFIDGMVRGEKAAKSFANSLSSIGQRLEDAGLNAIFNKLFDVTDNKPQSGGGLFGGVKKLFGFSSGGYTGDGGTYDAAGIVHRGEYVLSKQAVQNIGVGNLDTLHSLLKAPNGGYSLGNIAARMPRTPSMSDLRALQTQKTEKERAMSIHVTPSKYFDVHVEEISGKVTSTGIQQYDKVLDNTLGAKLNNGRQMNRY